MRIQKELYCGQECKSRKNCGGHPGEVVPKWNFGSEMFRQVKRMGRRLSLTSRQNDFCKGNRSIKWHNENRAY